MIQSCPFILAGALAGWALSGNVKPINVVYASSLIGASLGSIGAMVFLSHYSPNALIIPIALVATVGCIGLVPRQPPRHRFVYSLSLVLLVITLGTTIFWDADKLFPLRVDQYKMSSHVQQLTAQGSAKRLQTFHGLRGRVQLYTSPHFHSLLSLASTKPISLIDLILKDGIQVGKIPVVKDLDQAAFLGDTLFALPYSLLNPQQILILGESGAFHIWTARLFRPKLIMLVQPDKNVIKILESHPTRPLDESTVRIQVGDARAFLEKTKDVQFDVIQLAELEGFVPGTSGIGGLRENYLATVQGFQKCLEVLAPEGVVCTVRGLQDPPRDNIKILATWFEALRANKSLDPANHLLVARDELSCAILCWKSPVDTEVCGRFAAICDEKSWDREWAPGIKSEETNRLHVIPGPSGSSVSWYYAAIEKFRTHQAENFYHDWISYVRPATDDKPYFFDFFRMASISLLKRQFGPLWATRSEMGFLVLLVCLLATFVAATVFLVGAVWGTSNKTGKHLGSEMLWMILFFAAIGIAFMFVEILLIQTFTRVFGDPVMAAGAVLAALLLFSGLGSILQPKITGESNKSMLLAGFFLGAMLFLTHAGLYSFYSFVSVLNLSHAMALAIAVVGPIGVLMGVPFPWAMSKIERKRPAKAPVCWTVNCFASVVSSPLAIVASMTLGFRFLWLTASLLYSLVGILAVLKPKMVQPQDDSGKLEKVSYCGKLNKN